MTDHPLAAAALREFANAARCREPGMKKGIIRQNPENASWEKKVRPANSESETNDEKSDAHGNRSVDLGGDFIDGAGRDYAAET